MNKTDSPAWILVPCFQKEQQQQEIHCQ